MVSKKGERFIDSAAEQATKSPCLMRHGCVAVLNGRVIGRGFNNYRCNSRDGFIKDAMTCHAEIAALRQVNKATNKFKKIVLYVVRLDSDDILQESCPCIDCMNKIQDLGIKRVIHSTNGGGIEVREPVDYFTKHITTGKRIFNINHS